jgi:O-6-methylguanine DNA methyltransferase
MNLITLATNKIDGLWFAAALNQSGEIVHTGFSPSKGMLLEEIIKRDPSIKIQRDDSEGRNVLRILGKLIRGEDADLAVRINLDSATAFQRSVYNTLRRVPRGKVSTYSMLAEATGRKRAARAVGNCVASNPLPLIIPCHRIVLSSLKIGGYSIPDLDQGASTQAKDSDR